MMCGNSLELLREQNALLTTQGDSLPQMSIFGAMHCTANIEMIVFSCCIDTEIVNECRYQKFT